MVAITKPSYLLDTGPLSVLCGFPLKGEPYIHSVLNYCQVVLPADVVTEIQNAPSGKIARTMTPLLKSSVLSIYTPSSAPPILDLAYGESLGLGERAIIKAALASGFPIVIDDKDAFIIACRFGLRPVGFQDFMIRLVREQGMAKEMAVEIVKATARQYPATFLAHTLDLLSQE